MEEHNVDFNNLCISFLYHTHTQSCSMVKVQKIADRLMKTSLRQLSKIFTLKYYF